MKILFLSPLLVLTPFTLAQALTFSGNGNTGFGGALGQSSLELTDDGTTLTGVLTRGSGDFNDIAVLYIDSVAGGFADTSTLNDDADGGREAISFGGSSTLSFDTGFEADYAISLDPGAFFGMFELNDGGANAHSFIREAGTATGSTTVTDATYTFIFDFTDIGLAGPGNFDFVLTYLNPFGGTGTEVFASDEAIGSPISGGNPGTGSLALSGSDTYVVPEPQTFALLAGLSALTIITLRRR